MNTSNTEPLLVAPDTLPAHPKRIRRHAQNLELVLESVRQFGWKPRPVIVSDRTGFVVDGHLRVEAAKRLGRDVPVVRRSFHCEHEEEAFLLRSYYEGLS
ncbi:MAG TPA: ParB N-terminal domain-containing protein [Methylomirabilota bacterium]|nr:ParB N-terminal domain-containing protein [Methylomirabilota bacterium]